MNISRNKTTIINIASTIVLQGISFFTAPVFSAILGTDNYGVSAVYLTWVQMASTVFTLQAGSTLVLARKEYPLEYQEKFQSSVLSLASISYFICSMVVLLFELLFLDNSNGVFQMTLLGMAQGWGMYCVSFYNSKYTYEFKPDKNFILSLVVSAFSVLFSLYFITLFPKDKNYWGKIIGQSIVYFLVGFVLFVVLLRRGKTIIKKEYWLFTLPVALPTIFHLLSGVVLDQSDKIMLQQMVDNNTTGIYALSYTFGSVLHIAWVALNNSWVPYYYEYTRLGDIKEMKKHARNYIELFTILSMIFILVTKDVYRLFANESFWSGESLISVFAMGYYFDFLCSFPINYEFFHKKTKKIAFGSAGAALANIVLNLLLINWIGSMGAAIASSLSLFLLFVFHFIVAKRIKEDEFPFKLSMFVPGMVLVTISFFISFLDQSFILVRWGIGTALGIFLLVRLIKRREIF